MGPLHKTYVSFSLCCLLSVDGEKRTCGFFFLPEFSKYISQILQLLFALSGLNKSLKLVSFSFTE